MIRVAVVDDQEMIRAGLRTIIEAHAELTVVAEGADGIAALRLVETVEIDLLLLDLRMPGIDGVEVIRRLRRDGGAADLRILVLTTFDEDENVLRALKAGADGFLSKGAGPGELTEGILEVAAGRHALSAGAVGALVDHITDEQAIPDDPAMAARFTELTPREHEVVRAIVAGMSNAEIADAMIVSPFTVKTHANRAMTKVGARDRAQLVSYAVRAGIRP
jgi:DNA-binding NarL/FixJ family response regulator